MWFAQNTQHDTSKVLRLPRKMTMDTSKVLRLPRKLQHIFWKRRKSIVPATQNDFRHVAEHVLMSRSATRNETTTHWKPPKMTTSAELPIGTAILPWVRTDGCGRFANGCERLRTAVANGCEQLRPQTRRRANTPSTPRPPEWNGNPCYAFGKNGSMKSQQSEMLCFPANHTGHHDSPRHAKLSSNYGAQATAFLSNSLRLSRIPAWKSWSP